MPKGKQITLLDGPECHICHRPLQLNGHIYDGFVDADTQQYCHHLHSCKQQHYQLKLNGKKATTFSEMPVTPQTYFK
jgi:hypothetical protein